MRNPVGEEGEAGEAVKLDCSDVTVLLSGATAAVV